MPRVSAGAADEEDDVDDEEEAHGDFEDEEVAVEAVGLEELVEVVEGFEFFVDGFVPFGEVETGGDGLVDAGEVPVAEELGDVGEFIGHAGEVDADFAEVFEGFGAAPAPQSADRIVSAEIAVGAVDDGIEDAVVGFELGELEVGEFHEVDHFVDEAGFVDDECGVPVDDDDVVVVVGERAGGGFVGFLSGEVVLRVFFGEEGGDLAAVGFEPVFGGNILTFCSFQGGGDAEDGVGFFFAEAFDGPRQAGSQLPSHFFRDGDDLIVHGGSIVEAEVMESHKLVNAGDFKGHAHGNRNCPDGEQLDLSLDADGSAWSDAFHGGEADHLGSVEEKLSRGAFVGVHLELCNRLSEQRLQRCPRHFVGDVVGVEVGDGSGVFGHRNDAFTRVAEGTGHGAPLPGSL